MSQREKIIDLLKQGHKMTQSEIAKAIYQEDGHYRAIYAPLHRLVNEGIVSQTGNNPAYYSMNKKANVSNVIISKSVKELMDEFSKMWDDHGRYQSYDSIYSSFNPDWNENGSNCRCYHCCNPECKNYCSKNGKAFCKDYLALQLFMYLASWGMLRNSFLLNKDYTYLIDLVDILLSVKKPIDNTATFNGYTIDEILNIKQQIINFFKGPNNNPTTYYDPENGLQEVRGRTNWDTLTSKIMLGTLGCVPAYDTYFKKNARKVGIRASFSENGLKDLEDFVKANKNLIDALQQEVKSKTGLTYPIMKIVDMIFWLK